VGATASLRDRLGESELLLQNECLVAKNRILRVKLPAKLQLNNPERATLAEIGKRLGRKVLGDVACVAKHDTILAGIGRSSPRSSMAPNTGGLQGALLFHRKWKHWWCQFRSPGRWPRAPTLLVTQRHGRLDLRCTMRRQPGG
jgi:hypothetical protein